MAATKRKPECPNAADHTPCPDDYIARHEWASAMTETHKQVKCEGCGRWTIWVPLDGEAGA